ncbi:MAG TPA: hypothetical protein VHS78_13140 [Candidatus Elarobacter sp.]|jgi:hypothetical protein|nr:hypothetical protein [Candidatus Elarobacter sp.]
MLFRACDEICDCGHPSGLHDRNGCAAFLGAFPATASQRRYCRCKHPRHAEMRTSHHGHGAIVATVTLRERNGSAIAVCESPPVLELGGSADDVLRAIKVRLLDAIEPRERVVSHRLRVIRHGPDRSEESIEILN